MIQNSSIFSGVSLRDTLVIIVICFIGLLTIANYTKNWRDRRSRYLKLAKCLPGPPSLPLIGNALKFACKPEQLLDRLVSAIIPYENRTPMILWLGSVPNVVITVPRDLQIVLNSQQATQKGMSYRFLFPFIGEGLISGSGERWRSHRKMITHVLNPQTLREYVNIFDRRSQILIKTLMKFADKRIFDIFESLERCAVDIMAEAVMGCTDINSHENPHHEFLQSIGQMYQLVHERVMKIWLHSDYIFRMTKKYQAQCNSQKIARSFVDKCIAAKRQDLIRKKDSRDVQEYSILERILEVNDTSHVLTDKEIRDEIYTVFLASEDTAAVVASFACLMLAIHQDVQEKVRKEIQEIFNDTESITFEYLDRMKYLEMCIKETLRLFPIAPFLIRHLREELALDKYTLPEGCEVVVAAYVTHRSKQYWRDPEQFIPERFSIEESARRHPYAYIPFSAGPMNCIGQKFAMLSLKTMLARMLRNFKITTNVRMQDIRLKADISIRSINGYKVALEPLHKKQALTNGK